MRIYSQSLVQHHHNAGVLDVNVSAPGWFGWRAKCGLWANLSKEVKGLGRLTLLSPCGWSRNTWVYSSHFIQIWSGHGPYSLRMCQSSIPCNLGLGTGFWLITVFVEMTKHLPPHTPLRYPPSLALNSLSVPISGREFLWCWSRDLLECPIFLYHALRLGLSCAPLPVALFQDFFFCLQLPCVWSALQLNRQPFTN